MPTRTAVPGLPSVCRAAAQRGNLSVLKWLRQHGCPWDSPTSHDAAAGSHLELLKWARLQQPACLLWSRRECYELFVHKIHPCMLVYLVQQQAHLPARHLAHARVAAEMTYAVLSLRAALPDRTPHEVVLKIVSLAFA